MAETDIHYPGSPKMIPGESRCTTDSIEKLKKMSIDQRWERDNRIPTWNFGMANFRFDQNFIHQGNIINDTDDFVQTILSDKEGENGAVREVTGTRKIKFNGGWFRID